MIRKAASMTTETRPLMRGGSGTVTVQHLFSKDEIRAKTRLCARLTLPAGASIGVHQHNGEDELYLITKGAGVLDDGTTKTPVDVGDAILTGNGESHAISNPGPGDLEIIAVIMCYA